MTSSAELFDSAVACQAAGHLTEALALFDRLQARHPEVAEVQIGRGDVLLALQRPDEALACFEGALLLRPETAGLHIKKGIALQLLQRLYEALACYDRAIALDAREVDAHHNRGTVLGELGRLDEAIACYDAALRIQPNLAKAHSNKALALQELQRLDEALESHDRALALMPDFGELRFNKALCNLLLGRFAEGWPLYEARTRRAAPVVLPAFDKPVWSGEESLAGKTLLLHAEQGLGDTIQFCRYAALAEACGAKVVFSVPAGLMRLLADSGISAVDAAGPIPDCDYHSLLLSMPLAFKTDADTIPAAVPYLTAQPERVKAWSDKIGQHGFKVGIAWQGDSSVAIDKGRSIPLHHFAALAAIPGVRLVSLQKNDGVAQLTQTDFKIEQLEALDEGGDAFVDTAAVMQSLDLVITSDTAIAHLAGALGRPVWVALKQAPDWRWQLGRDDSPWYPSMRLFRQTERGNWPGVFEKIGNALAGL